MLTPAIAIISRVYCSGGRPNVVIRTRGETLT